MTQETIPELTAIARQIEDQLEFYRQVGITDIGLASRPPLPSEGASDAPPEREHVGTKEPASTTPLAPQAIVDPGAGHAEPAVQQVSLFGEVAESTPRPHRTRPSPIAVLEAKDSSLHDIREDIGDCRRCRLHEGRKNIVFGEGSTHARLVFVGEGPGADEDATGRPFVGRAGQLLDKIIAAIGLEREQVYIANVVKCRPPGNRTPERDEVETCEPFLFRQLALIRPKVIVALGSPAFQCLLRTREPITRSRGQWRDWNGIRLMPTFHPAYLLRSPDKKRETWEDMKKVRDYLRSLDGTEESGAASDTVTRQ